MRQAWWRPLAAAGFLFLAGCASVAPPLSGLPHRDQLRDFSLEARFALRLENPHEPVESASGRLSWQHVGGKDQILVSNPLGQGIAEIEVDQDGARLRAGDGRVKEAADPAALLQESTGYPLPLGELPAWLLGRPGSGGQVQTDGTGRPRRLAEAGWRIEYDYDDPGAGALPSRLTLHRDNNIQLRLRIEEWRIIP